MDGRKTVTLQLCVNYGTLEGDDEVSIFEGVLLGAYEYMSDIHVPYVLRVHYWRGI